MSEFTKELDRRIEGTFIYEPQDVRRTIKHSAAKGRQFAQHIYSYMQMWEMMEILYQHYKLAQAGIVDLDTMKAVVNSALVNSANRCKSNKMEDTMSVYYRAVSQVNGAKSHEELAELIRKVELYTSRMFYNLDLAFPWEKMCQHYNKEMESFVSPARDGTDDVADD
jgi:hypothetical protein